jgi:hypothetical protein
MRRGQLGNASQLLRQLGLGKIPLTHDAFHELQPWRAASHLEELLMACGVLPAPRRSSSSRPGTSSPDYGPELSGATSHPASAASPANRSSTRPPSCNGSASGAPPSRHAARSTSTPGSPRTLSTLAPG